MDWAITYGFKFLRYLKEEFGFAFIGLAITYTIYAALYLIFV